MQSCGISDAEIPRTSGLVETRSPQSLERQWEASVQQKGMSPGGTIHLMLVSSVPVTLVLAEPVQGLTTMFPCVGFTWQDFKGGAWGELQGWLL